MDKPTKTQEVEFDKGWLKAGLDGTIRLMPMQYRAFKKYFIKHFSESVPENIVSSFMDNGQLCYKGHIVLERRVKPSLRDTINCSISKKNKVPSFGPILDESLIGDTENG